MAAEHVIVSPYAIHSMDAAAVVAALLADETIVQVYDGIIQNPLKNTATVASNDSFLSNITNENFSPISAMADALEHSKGAMNELFAGKNNPNANLNKTLGRMLSDTANDVLIEGLDYISEDGSQVRQDYTHEEFIKQLREMAKSLKEYRASNKRGMVAANQYADVLAPNIPAVEADLDASNDALVAMNKAVSLSSDQRPTLGTTVVITSSGIPENGVSIGKSDRARQRKKRMDSDNVGVTSDAYADYASNLNDKLNAAVASANEVGIEEASAALDSILFKFNNHDKQSLVDEEIKATEIMITDALQSLEDKGVELANESDTSSEEESTEEEKSNEEQQSEIDLVDSPVKIEGSAFVNSVKTVEPDASNNVDEEAFSGGTFTDNVVHESTVELDSKNTVDLFRDLLTKNSGTENTMSTEHTEYLEGLLSTIGDTYNNISHKVSVDIRRAMDNSGNEGHVNFKEALSKIRINLRNRTGTGTTSTSAQEVFSHEMVHPFWNFGLKDRFVRKSALKMFHRVNSEKGLDYTIFLRDGNQHTPAEIATAKGNFNHVFNNGLVGLEEFLTFATTNEAFRNKLSNIVQEPVGSPKGILANIGRLFSKIIGLVYNSLSESTVKGGNITEQIDNLLARTATVINEAKDRETPGAISNALSAVVDKSYTAVNSASRGAVKALIPIALMNSTLALNFEAKNIKENTEYFNKGGTSPVTKLDTVMNAVRDGLNAKSEYVNEHVRDIFVHLAGDKLDVAESGRLTSKGTTDVDAVSDNLKTGVLEQLHDGFVVQPTDDQKRDITNVIGRTDLSSLYERSVSNEVIVDHLRNSKTVVKSMDKIVTRIGSLTNPSTANRILGHAMATANFMVNENQDKGATFHNADNIINYVGKIDSAVKANKATLIPLVDLFLTLSAIDHTDADARNRVADMMEHSDTSKGIANTLTMQRAAAKLSKETQFNTHATKHLYRKGYYSQNTDVNVAVTMAPVADKEIQQRGGYRLVEEITIPKGMQSHQPLKMGIYIRNFGGNKAKSNSAILSTTNKAFGEDISSLIEAANVGLPEGTIQVQRKAFNELQRNHLRKVSDGYARGIVPTSIGNYSNIVPTFTAGGNTGRFRMNPITTDFKEKYLRLDMDYSNSLATGIAQLSYKHNAPIHNQEVLKSLIETFNRDFDSKPNDFIKLLPDDVRYKRIISSWDEGTKNRMFSAFSGNPKVKVLYIKSNQITAMMGYHTFSVEDYERNEIPEVRAHKEILRHLNNGMSSLINNRMGAFTHFYTKEYVSELAKAIVVKTGTVMTANLTSNILITGLYGMDMFKTARDSVAAVKHARDYIADRRDSNKLVVKIAQEEASVSPNKNQLRKWKSIQASHEASMKSNPVHALAEAGELSTVITDATVKASNTTSVRGKVREKYDRTFLSKGIVGKAVREGLMLEDSESYKFMQQATILSDFVFKYAMYKHNEGRMSEKENLAKIKYIFFDYNVSSPKSIEALESMGFLMFTKYKIRSHRVVLDAWDENGARAILQYGIQTEIAHTANLVDSNYGIGNADLGNLFQNPFTKWDDIIQPNPVIRLLGSALTEK